MTLVLSSVASTATARHDATETITGVGPTTVIHDQDIVNSETRLTAELGIRPWLAAGFVVPLRVFNTSIRYLDPSGDEVVIDNPYVHHHNDTIVGIGDPLVAARAARTLGGFLLGGRLGVTLPLGRTEPDPFALGDMGMPHEHSQFGSGTFQPVLGLDAARTFGSFRVDAFALTVQSLYENGQGYQAGDRYAVGAGVASALGTKRWRYRATFESQFETAERWGGMVHHDEGNTGRIDLLAGAELTFRATDDWHLSASLKIPVYTHVEGGQLDASAYAGLAIGTQLRIFDGGEDHDHGDDHEHHDGDDHHHDDLPPPDWSGLDMTEVSSDGRVVALEPVPGKITVFDFWATWCDPCKVVDRDLAELARKHPDAIAVRKVNIVNDDSPASKRYLEGYTLPHLKVYGRDGVLLWEHSKPPKVLGAEVAQLLTSPPKPRPAIASARRIAIDVTDAGYVPARIEIARGEPVTLVFTRKSESTCGAEVTVTLPDGARLARSLPMGKPVEIPLQIDRAGDVGFVCGMDMFRGTIVVK